MNELSPQDSRLIDDYLFSRLNETDRVVFEQRETDPLFSKELKFRASLVELSNQRGDKKLQTLLEEESKRLDQIKPKRNYRFYWIILALLMVAGLCYFVFVHEKQMTTEQLFLAHYEVFPNLIAPSERSNDKTLIGAELALYNYDNKDYKKADLIFDTLSGMNNDLLMYHAISLFESGEYDRTKMLLQTLSNDGRARYQEAAQWYLCLLYLKIGDIGSCEKNLNSILSIEENKYFAKAKRLQQALEPSQ